MATELDRLFVTLEADLSAYQSGLKRAGVDLDAFTRDAETKTARVSRTIDAGMAQSATSSGRAAQQMQNLSYQMNDVITGIASGQPAFQILAQQGGQIYQALGSNGGVAAGLKAVKDGIASVLTPTTLLAGGFAAAGVAAVVAGVQFVNAQDEIKRTLSGIGSASGATVRDIQNIAETMAATRNITVGAARDIATSIAATGKVDVGNISGIANLAPGYAKILGINTDEAGQRLAKIFASPTEGAKELQRTVGSLNADVLEAITNLEEQGRRQEAILRLRAAYEAKIQAAVPQRSTAGQIYDYGVNLASRGYNYVGSQVAPALDQQPLADRVTQKRAQFEIARDRAAASGGRYPQELENELRSLEREFQKVEEAARKAFETDKADELAARVKAIFKAMDPEGETLQRLGNQLDVIGQQIAKTGLVPANDEDAKRLDGLLARFGDIAKRIDIVTEAQKRGGAAAKSAIDAADFSKEVAGLSNYERGLREIVRRYEEMARTAPNATAAQTFREAGAARVEAYKTANVQTARGELNIPEEFYSLIRAAESSGNDRAVSDTGAVGRYQFIESTWLKLFTDVKSSRYAEIRKANTGENGQVDESAVRSAVLALRTDPGLQEEMVRALTVRNAAELDTRGVAPTVRNLYGAHNIGPAGITALVKAQEEGRGGANAQSLLDPIKPSLVSANRAYYGNGKTVDEALATLDRKTQANSASARAAKEDVIATDAQTAAMGRSAVEMARLKSANDDLREAREKGEEVGRIFKDGDDLLKRGVEGLTGAVKAQAEQFIANANARGQAVSVQLNTRFQQDQKLAREALGRTYEEQSAYSQARSYGTPGSQAFEEAKAGITEIQSLAEAKNYTSSFLKDLNRDLMQTGDLGKAALGALSNLLSRAADRGLDKIAASLFSSGGGGTGIFDMVAKFFAGGFAGGGYTGDGGRNEPAGVVHKGEVVWSQDDVRRHGGARAVDTVRRGLPGYAKGGVVAGMMAATMPAVAMPRIPAAVPARTSSPSQVDARTQNFDMRGSNFTEAQARAMFAQALAANNAENRRTIGQQFADWKEDH